MPIFGIIMLNMGTINSSYSSFPLTKVQKKILKLLYLNENSEYYLNEIIKLTNSGSGSVQIALKILTNAGIIKVKKMGNQKRFQANKSLSYYSELRSIIIKTFGLADIIAQELHLIRQIQIAFIYGSVAKQNDTPESDVDLLLIGNDLTYAELFESLSKVEGILGRKINPSFYSVQEWSSKYEKGNNFIKQILIGPKIFLIGNEDDIKKLR